MPFPDDWVEKLTRRIREPNCAWSHFNPDLEYWRRCLKTWADNGWIAPADLPAEPVPSRCYLEIFQSVNFNWHETDPIVPVVETTNPVFVEGGGRFKSDSSSEDNYWIGGYDGPKRYLIPDKVTEMASRLPEDSLYILDIERWYVDDVLTNIDIIGYSASTSADPKWNAAIEDLASTIEQFRDLVKAECPGARIGYYYFPPFRELYQPINYGTYLANGVPDATARNLSGMNTWAAANDAYTPILEFLDVLCPSLYRFFVDTPEYYIQYNLSEALRIGGGKPLYPFLWSQYHNAAEPPEIRLQNMSMANWEQDIRWCRDFGADGIICWNSTEPYIERAAELQYEPPEE
jgi:hypothetical protein